MRLRLRRHGRAALPARLQQAGALASAVALGALIAIGPPGTARAAGPGYNQITGAGATDSAITVPWAQGLLDTSNKPIAAADADRTSASPASPYSFMYSDFRNLSVTVSQTADITHQGVTVSWKGGVPSVAGGTGPQADFLQLMECYGDAAAGPDPDQCEYGSVGLLPSTIPNPLIGQRIGHICAPGAVPSVTSPPGGADGSGPLVGCDPQEPLTGASPAHVDPCTGASCPAPTLFDIPFVPANDPSDPVYQGSLDQDFNEFSTNEVQQAITSPDGTGQLQFETLTGTQAPGLGCGEQETGGAARGCWLVIVPRGEFEPNGFHVNLASAGTSGFIQSSPLSASNWAMRIQIHLGYAPVQTFCPIGTQERETVGTQVASRAVQSWQLALNKTANCTKVYGYSAVPESTSTQQLTQKGSGVGLAFTTIPIGSEIARDGGHASSVKLPPILYAPVAVSALGFGFNINDGTGAVTTPVKMSPELLAKSITQVYRFDLPDFYPSTGDHPGPAWSLKNPFNLSDDPEFQKLNPGVRPFNSAGISISPLLTEDHSGINQQVWQWIQDDPATDAWLDTGKQDAANTVTADPDYEKLGLGRAPPGDSFPRAYAGQLNLALPGPPPTTAVRRSLDLLPYTNNYDSAASSVLTADNPTTGNWDPQAIAPDGSTGWWDKNGVEPLGQIFIWGIADTPDLAAYGLVDAQLCDDAGTTCVVPSLASVTTALSSAKKDSAGLLQVDPAAVGKGGYPLVQVTYAAVPTNQSAAVLNDYADLIAYAAGPGQTPGVAPGDLPPGYLPMPASLKAQARTVVAKLRADAGTGSPVGGNPPPSGGGQGSGGQGATTSTGGSGGQASLPPAGSTPSDSTVSLPSAQLEGTRTPGQSAGPARWILLAVVTAGAVLALSGAALRFARVPGWLRRMRT